MAHFALGDTVQVAMPKGFSKRGVPGISVLYFTWPEARFEGAVGHITEINPRGALGAPLFLVDFRGHDNGRLALPYLSQWFREEWIGQAEQPGEVAPRPTGSPAEGTQVVDAEPQPVGSRTGVREESQADPVAPSGAAGATDQAVPTASGVAAPGSPEPAARSSDAEAATESPARHHGGVSGAGRECPPGYPIKGNAGSKIYHLPGQGSYNVTVAEVCFATEADAQAAGFRPRKR